MKENKYRQVACIAEKEATVFEQKLNAVLAGIVDPEIVLDRTRTFTAYVFYTVSKDVPESLLELLEMMDDDGRAQCEDCKHFQRDTDKRKRWHRCTRNGDKVRADGRACEVYYMEKMQAVKAIADKYDQIPYRPKQGVRK